MSKSFQSTRINSNSTALTAIRPLIFVLQVTGFATFSINPTNFKAEVKFWNILSAISAIGLNLLLHYIFWFSYFEFDVQGTEIAKSAIPKLVYSSIFVYSLVKILNFLNRRKIGKFIQKIHKIDEKFKDLDVHFDYRHEKLKIYQTLSLVCVLALVMSILGFCVQTSFSTSIDMSLSLFNFYCNVCGFFITYQLATAMVGIKIKFEAVNNFLTSKTDQKIQELQILTEIHFMTMELIEMFNSIFGPASMMCMALIFSWHCIISFMTVMMSSVMWTKYILVSLFHVLMHVVMMLTAVIVIYYGEHARNEGRKTVKLLYKKLNRVDCGKTAEKIQSWINQICDTKVEFSCGLVDFNWKFLFQVRLN